MGEPATAASDRYALAVVAFELLTGAKPFTAENFAAQARAHVEDEPPRASERDIDVPPAVDRVLDRGMAKEPGDRWDERRRDGARARRRARRAAAAPPRAAARRRDARDGAGPAAAGAAAAPPAPAGAAPAPRLRRRRDHRARRAAAGRRRRRRADRAAATATATGTTRAARADADRDARGRRRDARGDATTDGDARADAEATPSRRRPRRRSRRAEPKATPSPGRGNDPTSSSCARSSSTTPGTTRRRCRSPQKAVKRCEGSTAVSPCAYALFEYAKALRLTGNPQAAIAVLEERKQRFPRQPAGRGRAGARARPRRRPARATDGPAAVPFEPSRSPRSPAVPPHVARPGIDGGRTTSVRATSAGR